MPEDIPMWPLTAVQADGLACVVCGSEFVAGEAASVPVGRSQNGSQVFACEGHCVRAVNDTATVNIASALREETESGEETARDVIGGAGAEYWRLLRDLRALVGAEALLTVTDDVAGIRDLLRLTVRHSWAAADRALRVLDQTASESRTEPGEGDT
ncbi:hypothetical protein [Streptomyces sp. AA1529]|uniref:hypothetical protein n=1 Tax=Streptomyces sp. AA1529 TaxID=1203257 RepID=UPI000370CA77|nr:hypothetical protein [Streptomyces sp. AA1529]